MRWWFWVGGLTLATVGFYLWTHLGSARPPYRYFKILTEVLYLIDQRYVEAPDYTKVRWGALVGMAKSLGQNTSILTPPVREAWENDTMPEGDVGLQWLDMGSYLWILAVYPDSPAHHARLRRGDQVYAIGDVPVIRMTAVEAYYRVRGEPGSQVRLAVLRRKQRKPEYVPLTRKPLPPVIVESAYYPEERWGYLHLYRLGEVGDAVIRETIRRWQMEGIDRLVLDLRQCTDLTYETAWRIADLFVQESEAGGFIGKRVHLERRFHFRNDDDVYRGPIVVVQDASTGWGCEVLAAILQDHGRARVVGQASLGMALWYRVVAVDEEISIWLPIARFRRFDGQWLGQKGVQPDVRYEQEGWDPDIGFIEGDAVVSFALEQLVTSQANP